jgi:hypothetical protein
MTFIVVSPRVDGRLLGLILKTKQVWRRRQRDNKFFGSLPGYRIIGVLVAADMAGPPTLSAGPVTDTFAVGASGAARHAVPATKITLTALANETAMILKWVRRSAPIKEWVISGSLLQG